MSILMKSTRGSRRSAQIFVMVVIGMLMAVVAAPILPLNGSSPSKENRTVPSMTPAATFSTSTRPVLISAAKVFFQAGGHGFARLDADYFCGSRRQRLQSKKSLARAAIQTDVTWLDQGSMVQIIMSVGAMWPKNGKIFAP